MIYADPSFLCSLYGWDDTFWTFDEDQRKVAAAVGRFRRVPDLVKA